MANPNTGIHAISTRGFERPGAVGQVADNHPLNRRRDLINTNPQAVQISTATFTGVEVSYALVVGGISITWTPASSPGSAAAVAEEFETWWNEQAVLRAWMTASYPGSGAVVTLTGNNVGLTIDLTNTTGVAFVNTTSAASASAVPFGRAMLLTGYTTAQDAQLDPDGTLPSGVLAATGVLTAQVDTWTVADPGTGQFIGATLKIAGVDTVIAERVPWSTNLDTTLDNLATVLNAALADAGLSAYVTVAGPAGAPGAGELRFTAAIAGVEFASMVTSDDAAGYPVITVSSNKALATSLLRRFAGASIRATDEVPSAVGSTSSTYGANRGVRVLAEGPMWVESSESPAYGDQVFVGLGSGEEGRFYKDAGASRIPLPLDVARWQYSARSGEGDAAAVVRFRANL